MPILVKPTMKCNSNCEYCYEKEIREQGKYFDYDLNAIEETIKRLHEKLKANVCFHGGEFLILPKKDAERLLKFGFDLAGKTSIQTNGLLVDDDIIEMFKKYKTSVGVSIDGPDELNLGRWREKNRERTKQVIKNIYRMRVKDLSVGLIVVVTRHNCLPPQRQKLKEFILDMQQVGCNSGRLNPVLGDGDFVPSAKEFIDFYSDMCDFVLSSQKLQWQPFRDIVNNFKGSKHSTCLYHQCDYFWTKSAHVVLGDGSNRSCMKTIQGGNPLQGNKPTGIRYELLFGTPQENGGCKGCKYWTICGGLCPAEGIDGDWRNKTVHCEVYYHLYQQIEARIKGLFPDTKLITDTPAKSWKDSISNAEFLNARGKGAKVCKVGGGARDHGDSAHGDSAHGDGVRHGDSDLGRGDKVHGDAPHGDSNLRGEARAHGDSPHGDAPHGDYAKHADSG